jgi:3-deoxy-D-manno-octulosonic acid kinase
VAISVTAPEGYESLQVGTTWGFAQVDVLPWLRDTLGEQADLREWAKSRPSVRTLQGRGRVFSVGAPLAGPDGRARWVVRHYHRGGAVARALKDRYLALGPPRPVVETRASVEIRRRGVPTPAVVAGVVYPAGVFYRADLATEEIPDALDLAGVLFDASGPVQDMSGALRAATGLIRLLEKKGVHHPDLNAKNIVISHEGGSARAHLVDLDRCRVREAGVPAPSLPMRRRLMRSLRKLEQTSGRLLGAEVWDAFVEGFEEGA